MTRKNLNVVTEKRDNGFATFVTHLDEENTTTTKGTYNTIVHLSIFDIDLKSKVSTEHKNA